MQFLVSHSLRATPRNKRGLSVASFVMYEAKLTHITFTTVDASSRTVVLPGETTAKLGRYSEIAIIGCVYIFSRLLTWPTRIHDPLPRLQQSRRNHYTPICSLSLRSVCRNFPIGSPDRKPARTSSRFILYCFRFYNETVSRPKLTNTFRPGRMHYRLKSFMRRSISRRASFSA